SSIRLMSAHDKPCKMDTVRIADIHGDPYRLGPVPTVLIIILIWQPGCLAGCLAAWLSGPGQALYPMAKGRLMTSTPLDPFASEFETEGSGSTGRRAENRQGMQQTTFNPMP
ncbi:MAG: hypothetical protein Q4B17_01995, partial [Lautropia sp.]|nr:hypothetical protein [Lautropia sp.]